MHHGETVNPSRNRKSGNGNPSPTARRGRFLSRPSSTVTLRHPDASWGAVHLINSGCRCGLPGAALARPVLLRYLTRLPEEHGTALSKCNKMGTQMIWFPLLNHLVDASEQRGWNGEVKRLRRLEVDHQLELGRLLNGQVCRLGAC